MLLLLNILKSYLKKITFFYPDNIEGPTKNIKNKA